MRRFLSRTTAVVLVLTVVVAGATSAVLGYVIRVQSELDLLYTREASYASNRLRYELSRLEIAAKDVMYGVREPNAVDDLQLWYDIVWNRLDVIESATLYATMPGFETEKKVIQQLFAMHRAAEPLFLEPSAGLHRNIGAVNAYLEQAADLTKTAIGIASENRRRLVDSSGEHLRQLYLLIFALDALTIVSFFGFAGLLIVQLRRRDRQRRELESLSGQLQNALEVARTSIRHKDSFLAHMSHEFRTPLNAINGYAEFMLARYEGRLPEKCGGYLADIRTAGGQLLGFVNDLFDVSRLQALGKEIHLERVLAAEIVGEARQIASAGAPTRYHLGIVVRELDPSLSLKVDRRRIIQVLINLLTNAIQHSKATEPIEISVYRRGDGEVTFLIEDHGVGMDPEQTEHLFEPFWSASREAVVSKSGGLGLYICHELVSLHGGRIDVTSACGVGTRIEVVLPYSSAHSETIAA